ncbi:uncharacterized protein LOC114536745 isoform X2 [Dendronephthya gigantea]|uniref:uncharacterized protein LOC114536745 isoform X2 n=1 Tax=Dendronephthya gigantea TaxID=151771 RepID=UPI00106CD3B7|nr:uncharacterized protein LOC114536745 isoform X2 [Dendronephthya gigantea]XP_028413898.1 uncharacterized protein LOC114536745 isoform X2 [Dendronephthya gigantea]
MADRLEEAEEQYFDRNDEHFSFSHDTGDSSSTSNAHQDNDTVRGHAGWAVKRARDVIFKGQDKVPAKETVNDDSPVIFSSKTAALAVFSLLGEDTKQANGNYNFIIYEHVNPFFIYLHKLTELLLSPDNILREKENILKFCLDEMSTNKELRGRWNEITPNSDMVASVVVLQRIVTFFLKSKQQIIREKEGLKPKKNSIAHRQQLSRNKKCSAVSHTRTTVDQSHTQTTVDQSHTQTTVDQSHTQTTVDQSHIQTLRNNLNSSSLHVFLLHLQTLPFSEQENILTKFKGKELGKILKSLGQPAFFGKKKEKQIQTLLDTIKRGQICINFPKELAK